MEQVRAPSPFELDPEAIACPHAFYDELRSEAPVSFVEAVNAWVVTRYEDIREVLGNVEVFSSRYATGPRFADLMRTSLADVLERDDVPSAALTAVEHSKWEVLLTADPPLHDRQRKLVNRAFTPRQVSVAEPLVVGIATRLVDRFAERGEVELVAELAWPLPLEVIANPLGVPLEDMPRFKRWSDDAAKLVGNHGFSPDEMVMLLASQGEFYEYFKLRLAEARRDPQDDIIGKIATAVLPDGDTLSQDEQLGMLMQFVVAGHETTTNLIAMGALHLAREPQLFDRLRAAPDLVPTFVEEVLRLETPVQGLFRRARTDAVVGGVTIPAGDHVLLAYAAGNIDAETFTSPKELDLRRGSPTSHLSFGHGSHYCIGAPLARQEARVAFTLLLERLDDIRVRPGAEIRYNASYSLHGLERLDLVFSPRG